MDPVELTHNTKTTKNEGKKLEILFDGYFYDITDFVNRHPGGNVIKYYTEKGEDATLAILQFHHRSKNRVSAIMSSLRKRKVSDDEIGLDAVVLKKNRALTEDFTKLHFQLENEGYFEPSYTHVFLRILEIFIMEVIGLSLMKSDNFFNSVIGLAIAGLAHGKYGWIVHECGHNSFSGCPKVDRFCQALFMGFGFGLSSTWWTRHHNRHHAMPQRINRDVDLDTMPLLAFNGKSVKNSRDGKRFMVQNQAYLFVLFDTLLVGWFWKLYLHPKLVFKRRKYLEIFSMCSNFIYFYYFGFWPVFFSSWITSMYMFVNFSLNHTFLPVTTEPTHWIEYSLLHTANVEDSRWCDWWMGYLNYQIEHHLFPTMPQFRHRQIKDRVKALADKHNIPYTVHSYAEAFVLSLKNLANVAKELQCAE